MSMRLTILRAWLAMISVCSEYVLLNISCPSHIITASCYLLAGLTTEEALHQELNLIVASNN